MARNPLQGPVEALKFAVSFAQMDMPNAGPVERKTAERCVRQLTAIRRDQPERHDWTDGSWLKEPAIPRARLQRLHADARALLMSVVKGGDALTELKLWFAAVQIRWPLPPVPGAGSGVWIMVNGDSRDLYLYRVIRLLDELGTDRIQECPSCGRLFFRVTRKEYCSQRCQSRIYMRRYREQLFTFKKRGRSNGKARAK